MDTGAKRKVVWGLVVVLGVAHYDFWYWDDATLVFGFMPIGLFYQALISVLAGVCWFLVIKHAWPAHVEEWASADEEDEGSGSASGGPS